MNKLSSQEVKTIESLLRLGDIPIVESTEVPNQEINEIRDTICDGCLRLFEGDVLEDF